MKQLEFIEMIKIMLVTREIDLSEEDRKESLEVLDDIDKVLKEHYKNYIISEIQNSNCCHPSECGYDSWYSFFGDTDGSEIEEYMRLIITEDECEKLWKESHSFK